MHKYFTDWFHVIDPKASRETLEKRWEGIEVVLETLDKEKIVELCTFLIRSQSSGPTWFKDVFKQKDEVMPTRGIEEELRLLAVIVLHVAMEVEGSIEISVTAALSLIVGSFGIKDEPKWLREHIHEAIRVLSRTGEAVRTSQEQPKVGSPIKPDEVNSIAEHLTSRIEQLKESNDFLWWAFTKHSKAFSVKYSALPVPAVAFGTALDIYNLSNQIPLAPEAETLLLHVLFETPGVKEADLSFKNFLSGLDKEHVQTLLSNSPKNVRLLCPLHWGIAAVSEGRSWMQEFERSFEFRTVTKFSPAEISLQYLRELCLVRMLSKEDGNGD